jgi:hypothetical protein
MALRKVTVCFTWELAAVRESDDGRDDSIYQF